LLGEHVRSEGIEVSDRTVGRIMKDADLQPHRQQMYLTSHDDEFREKRDDVLRVYYEAPKREHIVCVDEKTGIQALERRYPDIPMEPGQPLRREFEYIRHGTLCGMGAFDVRRGKPFGFTSPAHDSDTFVELLDVIDIVYPPGRGHIIMDNLSAHDTPDVNEWFDEHPLEASLHSEARILAQPDRVLVLDSQPPRPRPRLLHLHRRPCREDRRLCGLVSPDRSTLPLVVPA
jgi:hypothetical protein